VIETINTITITRVYPCWSIANAFHVGYSVNDGPSRSKCMEEVDNAYHAVNRLINQVCEAAGTSRGQVTIVRTEGYDNEVKADRAELPRIDQESDNVFQIQPAVAEAPIFDVNTVAEPTKSTLYVTEIRPLTPDDGYEYTRFQHSDGLLVVFKEIDVVPGGEVKRHNRNMLTFEEGATNEEHAMQLFKQRWTQDWGNFNVVDVRYAELVELENAMQAVLSEVKELIEFAVAQREQEVREELQLVGRYGTVISINGTETESNLLYKDVVTALRNAEMLFANNSGTSATGFSVDYVNVIDIEAQFDRVVATVKADGRIPNGQYTYFNPFYVTVDDQQTADFEDSFGSDQEMAAYFEDFNEFGFEPLDIYADYDFEDVPF
jgi:hypothetical protein